MHTRSVAQWGSRVVVYADIDLYGGRADALGLLITIRISPAYLLPDDALSSARYSAGSYDLYLSPRFLSVIRLL